MGGTEIGMLSEEVQVSSWAKVMMQLEIDPHQPANAHRNLEEKWVWSTLMEWDDVWGGVGDGEMMGNQNLKV
jgi:hypothetical protein